MKYGAHLLSCCLAFFTFLSTVYVRAKMVLKHNLLSYRKRVLTIIFLPMRQVITGNGREVHEELQ
jgi:hypothetical protein